MRDSKTLPKLYRRIRQISIRANVSVGILSWKGFQICERKTCQEGSNRHNWRRGGSSRRSFWWRLRDLRVIIRTRLWFKGGQLIRRELLLKDCEDLHIQPNLLESEVQKLHEIPQKRSSILIPAVSLTSTSINVLLLLKAPVWIAYKFKHLSCYCPTTRNVF